MATPNRPPPSYDEIDNEGERLALEAPPEDDEDEEKREANKILDGLDLSNYNDVEKVLAQPEMTATRQRNYLNVVLKNAETRRKQVTAKKSKATKDFKAGRISVEGQKLIHHQVDKVLKEIREYKSYYQSKAKSIKGSGVRRGRGVYFYNNAKELLQKLMVIIGEMEAGNTSIKMRNMGQNILDTLLRNKSENKTQYQKLVKKYFSL